MTYLSVSHLLWSPTCQGDLWRPWVAKGCPSREWPWVIHHLWTTTLVRDSVRLSPCSLQHVDRTWNCSWGHLGTLDLEHFPISYACSITANDKVSFSKSAFTDIHLWLFPTAEDWDLASHSWTVVLVSWSNWSFLSIWSGPRSPPSELTSLRVALAYLLTVTLSQRCSWICSHWVLPFSHIWPWEINVCLSQTLKPLPSLQIPNLTHLCTNKWPTHPLNNNLKWKLSNFYQQSGRLNSFYPTMLRTAGVLLACHTCLLSLSLGSPVPNLFSFQFLLFCLCHHYPWSRTNW